MNKVVVVGNGFDLSHGLKTRYSDFLVSYLKDAMQKAKQNAVFEDSLVHVEFFRDGLLVDIESYFDRIQDLKHITQNESIIGVRDNNLNVTGRTVFKFIFRSELFKSIVNNSSISNWVDIEQEYFRSLVSRIKKGAGKGEVVQFNNELNCIREALMQYISLIEKQFDQSQFQKTNRDFDSAIHNLLYSAPSSSNKLDPFTPSALIINFNYTNTIERYIGNHPFNYTPQVLNIHGTVAEEYIIFGYGHVENNDYKLILDSQIDEAMFNLKLITYHERRDFHQLIEFIEDREFEVTIMGHSCGLSDGTILKMLFEHDNCKTIRVCHIGPEEHRTKRISIARHLTNSFDLKKVLPYDPNLTFPKRNI